MSIYLRKFLESVLCECTSNTELWRWGIPSWSVSVSLFEVPWSECWLPKWRPFIPVYFRWPVAYCDCQSIHPSPHTTAFFILVFHYIWFIACEESWADFPSQPLCLGSILIPLGGLVCQQKTVLCSKLKCICTQPLTEWMILNEPLNRFVLVKVGVHHHCLPPS